ncbi:MAG: DUF4235 domain-containing protein [Balneola sp.]
MHDTKLITKENKEQIILSGISLAAGLATKVAVEKAWEKFFREDSPSKGNAEEYDFKKVLLWTVITGTVISSAKLIATHFAGKKLRG